MPFYNTDKASFDLHQTDSGEWNVILMPDLEKVQIGTGKYIGCCDSFEDAQAFCDDWQPPL